MSSDDGGGWQFDAEDVEDDEVPAEDVEDDGVPADDEDGPWRFSVADVSEDDEGDDRSAVGGNVFGSLDSDTEVVEAGSPEVENVLFVALGVAISLLVFVEFFLLFT